MPVDSSVSQNSDVLAVPPIPSAMEYCESPVGRKPFFFAVFDLETFALLKIFGMKFINMIQLSASLMAQHFLPKQSVKLRCPSNSMPAPGHFPVFTCISIILEVAIAMGKIRARNKRLFMI